MKQAENARARSSCPGVARARAQGLAVGKGRYIVAHVCPPRPYLSTRQIDRWIETADKKIPKARPCSPHASGARACALSRRRTEAAPPPLGLDRPGPHPARLLRAGCGVRCGRAAPCECTAAVSAEHRAVRAALRRPRAVRRWLPPLVAPRAPSTPPRCSRGMLGAGEPSHEAHACGRWRGRPGLAVRSVASKCGAWQK
jgi:hypothetical protein